MNHEILLGILLFAPLLGFLFNGLRYKSPNYKLAGLIGSSASFVSFFCSLLFVRELWSLGSEAERVINVSYFKWILVGDLNIGADFTVDPISAVMLLVITGVGALIHIFSIGYMSHDKRPSKYFSYLNLFLFNMLVLVLGSNLAIMFVGWEGVGLCSYLLIGFWFTDKEKSAAGMKAFITNRIGDAGFLLGVFLIFSQFQTLDFSALASYMTGPVQFGFTTTLALACLCLFIGAVGKSAQIPLYVWLPDAMAGPTPVSALIHAATMVTAGIYMILRMSVAFALVPDVMMLIAWVGALTAFFAATIALTQWDIKKILAYSTVSQLGYMFLAVGVGAFVPALFHLVTHAFFKALMFLGSGSVIHSMDGEQDIRKMGGLKKLMPLTHFTFAIGWLAIIGIPPLAGFWSKDEILWFSFASPRGSVFLWIIGFVTAGLTAFYMTRLMALTFWGESRVSEKIKPHEPSRSMTIPLVVLALLSTFGGFLGVSHVISENLLGHIPHFLHSWLQTSLIDIKIQNESVSTEVLLMVGSVLIAASGALLAYYFYLKNSALLEKMIFKIRWLHQLVFNKYKVDELYLWGIINPLVFCSKRLWLYIDVGFIDRVTYIISDFIESCAKGTRSFQGGNLQRYALTISIGLVFILAFVLVRS